MSSAPSDVLYLMFKDVDMAKHVDEAWADRDSLAVEWNYARSIPQVWDCAAQLDTIHRDYTAQGFRHARTIKRSSCGPHPRTAQLVCYEYARPDEKPMNPLATAFGERTSEFVVVLKPVCCVCHSHSTQLCGVCRRLHYCSKRCQASDRNRHKRHCQPPKPVPKSAKSTSKRSGQPQAQFG